MIIGIDVGTNRMGIARLDNNGKLIESRQVGLGVGKNTSNRARMIRAIGAVETFVRDTWIPTTPPQFYAFIERVPYMHHNPRTHAVLYRFMGAIEGWLSIEEYCSDIILLYPAEIKKSFTGSGRATKEQVQQRAKELFNLSEVGEDEADALATAYAGWRKLEEQNAKH